MSKLFTVAALNCRVFIRKVASHLSLKLLIVISFALFRFLVTGTLVHLSLFFLTCNSNIKLNLLFEVLVASQAPTWNEQVRVKLGHKTGNVVLIFLHLHGKLILNLGHGAKVQLKQ